MVDRTKTILVTFLVSLCCALAGLACDDAVESCRVTEDGASLASACLSGQAIDELGAPIVGVRVAACTLMTCITTKTDEKGDFRVDGLPNMPQRVDIFAGGEGYSDLMYYQEVEAGVLVRAAAPIVVPRMPEEGQAWSAKAGGEVSLLGGQILLKVGADALVYPIGTLEDEMEVRAVELNVASLAPYKLSPWLGKEEGSKAFVFNPMPLFASEAIEISLKGMHFQSGKRFSLYAADSLSSEMKLVAEGQADVEGNLLFAEGSELKDLTTLVIVPAG